jgi:sugar lactone lactonase YvrE
MRYINSTPQIVDGNGKITVGAKKYFYRPLTSTIKNIYTDISLTSAQSNPISSDSEGRFNNIILDGIYTEVQEDDKGRVLWTRDIVGVIDDSQASSWANNQTYIISDLVIGSDDEYYRSLTDDNQGNNPTTDETNWEKITFAALENATPILEFNETDGSLDNKRWDLRIAGEQFQLRVLNDAEAVQTNILEIDRTGTTVDTINFSNGTLQNEGNDVLTPNVTVTVEGWDLRLVYYTGNSFSVAAQETTPQALAFSSDGFTMFVVGDVNGTVYQYTLTTARDVSTASYASKSHSVAAQDSAPTGLAFSSDGFKMFVVGTTNDTVYQYTLTTAWDVSTASYASKSFSVAAQETTPQGLAFSSDGFTMFVVGDTNDTVYQYTLTTAWDVSTASYASKSFSVAAQDTVPLGLAFSSDGFTMFVVGFTNDTVYQYTLTTAWDVSTASYASKSFSVAAQDTVPLGLAFSSDGSDMFIVGSANDTVYQYKTHFLRK